MILAYIQGFYKYRFLTKQLVSRDIKLKYRRSFLGYLWSVLNPLLTMIIMIIVFSSLFKSDIENFPVYLIIGQTLFGFMNEATNIAIGSITGNAALIKKTYVPKYIFTFSKVASSFVNMLFSMGALVIVFIICRVVPNIFYLFIPIVLIQEFIFTLGLSLFLAQFAVFFRDILYIYSVFTMTWMYLTPIFYPITILPGQMKWMVQHFNPMFFYIVQFRQVVFNNRIPDSAMVIYGCISAATVLAIGLITFKKNQDKFILYI